MPPSPLSTDALPIFMTGAELRQLRQLAGLSMRQLAQSLGCTYGLVFYWESEDAVIPRRMMPTIMDALRAGRRAVEERLEAETLTAQWTADRKRNRQAKRKSR